MKNIISTHNPSRSTDLALLTARIGITALMLTHGLPKLLLLFSGAPVQFPAVLGLSPELSLGLAVFAEVVCSALVLVGFATRLAAIPLIITMLLAVVLIHPADPFNVKEPALLYLLAYLVLMLAGSGRYSIDHLLDQKRIALGFARRSAKRTEWSYK